MNATSGIPQRRFLTVREVADRFCVSPSTILREIHDGALEAIKIRGQYRVGETALKRYEAAVSTQKEAE